MFIEFGRWLDVWEIHKITLGLHVLLLMLDLLLRKDVEVVTVPHVEHEETVEG